MESPPPVYTLNYLIRGYTVWLPHYREREFGSETLHFNLKISRFHPETVRNGAPNAWRPWDGNGKHAARRAKVRKSRWVYHHVVSLNRYQARHRSLFGDSGEICSKVAKSGNFAPFSLSACMAKATR